MINTRSTIIFCLLLTILGCEKPNPTPELSDPIYIDIKNGLESAEKSIESSKAEEISANKLLGEALPQTGQLRLAQEHLQNVKNARDAAEQQKKYLEIKLENRKSEDRKTYLPAFNKKQPWPDPKELADYEDQKKLLQVGRTWDPRARIEKLNPQKPVENKEDKEKTEKKAE